MYKLCAFDLDGTLVNTVADIAAATNYALAQLGFPAHDTEACYHFVGNGMTKLCERALPEGHKERTDELVALYNERYLEHCCELSSPYEGLPEALRELSAAGMSLAVVTNKPQAQTDRVIAHYYADIPFVTVLGASDRYPRKPAPDMLLAVTSRYGFLEGETLYIGDSDVDVKFAHAAQIPCAGVSWGFRGSAELESAGAEFIVTEASQIVDIALGR